jgi:hypothetical protein
LNQCVAGHKVNVLNKVEWYKYSSLKAKLTLRVLPIKYAK